MVAVVEVRRGDAIESLHRVHLAVADATGRVVAGAGDAGFVTFARSVLKPLQALPLLRAPGFGKLGLEPREIAVAMASHSGEAGHVEAVRALLAKGGVEEERLACGAHAPYHAPTAARLGDGRALAIHNNCSGKHAAMLVACRLNGWSLEGYLDPAHPLERAIAEAVARYSGLRLDALRWGVDGCGAPNAALPLRSLATALARLGRVDAWRDAPPKDAEALAPLFAAWGGSPWHVAGTGRFDTDLMEASEGRLLAKAGGEGIEGVIDLETGRALVVKVEDGAWRAVPPAVVEACRQLAWLDPRALEVLGEWWRPAVPNHAGAIVGRLEPRLSVAEQAPALGGHGDPQLGR
ncbi:MAG TPA: asparaginase [Candidatus Thermoplasmatota archaeon]|nr:asparaginase [Candidatus Thermoplasmatota archaeon]